MNNFIFFILGIGFLYLYSVTVKDCAERLNMKENSQASRTTRSAKTIPPAIASRSNPLDALPADALNLSPEKIQEKVSTPSKVLIQMLEGYDTVHYTRHWGINE